MPYKDPNKNRKYQRDWAKKRRKERKDRTIKLRIKVIEKLGGKCVYCRCDVFEALELNHKAGDGAIERRKKCQKTIYYEILDGKAKGIELTCRVCNARHYLKEILKLPCDWKIKFIPSNKIYQFFLEQALRRIEKRKLLKRIDELEKQVIQLKDKDNAIVWLAGQDQR